MLNKSIMILGLVGAVSVSVSAPAGEVQFPDKNLSGLYNISRTRVN